VLVLLDIDGTLLHGSPRAHTAALVAAMRDVHDVPAQAADVAAIRPGGRTDQEIARLVLRRHGVAEDAIAAAMPEWMARAAARYPEEEDRHPGPVVAPDAPAALGRMRRAGGALALLTGNLEPIARAKMARAGLGEWFAEGEGAFGSDEERRDALVPIALTRAAAGGEPPAGVVVVGDTPRDIACARAGGARCVAVATGPHAARELAAADAVAGDLTAAAAAVEAMLTAGAPL
jgi:phosphoglycolate phosphatase-like HAD superfamily hydrolase